MCGVGRPLAQQEPLTLILSPKGRGDGRREAVPNKGQRRQAGCLPYKSTSVARDFREKVVLENRTQIKNSDVIGHKDIVKNATWVRSTKRTQIQGDEIR